MDPMTAVAVGGAVASGVRKLVGKNRGIHGKVRNLNDRFLSQKPVGYLTNEDYAFAERGRERGARAIGELGRRNRENQMARVVARGLSMSPAAEYLTKQGEQDEFGALRDLDLNMQDRLYGIRMTREGREHDRLMTAWGAELGAVQSDFSGRQARDAAFLNSWLPVVEDAASYFSGGGGSGSGSTWMGQPGWEYPRG